MAIEPPDNNAPASDTAQGGGGKGGGIVDDDDLRHARRNLALLRKSVIEGWNVPESAKRAVVEFTSRVVNGVDECGRPIPVSMRTRNMAAKTLLRAAFQDLETVKHFDTVPVDGEEVRVIRTPLPGPPAGVPDERKE